MDFMLVQGFALANSTEKSIYETFSPHPDQAKRFGNAMASFEQGIGYDIYYLPNNFPWDFLGPGTVVDVSSSIKNIIFWRIIILTRASIQIDWWLNRRREYSPRIFFSKAAHHSAGPTPSHRRLRLQAPN